MLRALKALKCFSHSADDMLELRKFASQCLTRGEICQFAHSTTVDSPRSVHVRNPEQWTSSNSAVKLYQNYFQKRLKISRDGQNRFATIWITLKTQLYMLHTFFLAMATAVANSGETLNPSSLTRGISLWSWINTWKEFFQLIETQKSRINKSD
jgi:hypothetical protein